MFGFFKAKKQSSVFDTAMKNKESSDKRISKSLINIIDNEIKNNSLKGHDYAVIFPFNYDFKVTNECLELTKQHYESQGFEVEFDKIEERENTSDLRYKKFSLSW